MIGQIGPLVQAGSVPRLAVLWHVLGGIAGAATAAIVMSFAGLLLFGLVRADGLTLAFVVPAVAVVVGAADATRPWASVVGPQRQTPGTWSCALGPRSAMLAWGIDLSAAVTTRLPCYTLLLVVVYAVMAHSIASSVLVMVAFGVSRTAVVALSAWVPNTHFESMCSTYARSGGGLRRMIGLASVGLGTAMFAAMLV